MPKYKNEIFASNSQFLQSIEWVTTQPISHEIAYKLHNFYDALQAGKERYLAARKVIIKKYGNEEGTQIPAENIEEFTKEVEALNEKEEFYRFRKNPLEVDLRKENADLERYNQRIMPTTKIISELKGIVNFTGVPEDKEEDLEEIPEEFQENEVTDGTDNDP